MFSKLQETWSESFTSITSMPTMTPNSSTVGSFDGLGSFGSANLGHSGQRNNLQARMAASLALLMRKARNISGSRAWPRLTCTRRMARRSSRGTLCHLLLASSSLGSSNSSAAAALSVPKSITTTCLDLVGKVLFCCVGASLCHSSHPLLKTSSLSIKISAFLRGTSIGPACGCGLFMRLANLETRTNCTSVCPVSCSLSCCVSSCSCSKNCTVYRSWLHCPCQDSPQKF